MTVGIPGTTTSTVGSDWQSPMQPVWRMSTFVRPFAASVSTRAVNVSFAPAAMPQVPMPTMTCTSLLELSRISIAFCFSPRILRRSSNVSLAMMIFSLTLLAIFFDDGGHVALVELAVDLAVDDRDRRKAAAAEAAHGLDREHSVGRRRVDADAELALELVDDVFAAAQIAGRAHADLDDVLAGLLKLEEIVERHHAVYLRKRNIEHLGDFDGDVAGNVTIGLLDLMENHDEISWFGLPFGDEGLQLRRQR